MVFYEDFIRKNFPLYKGMGAYKTPAVPHWTKDAWKKGRFNTFRTKRDVWEEHKDGMRLIYRLLSYSSLFGIASIAPLYFFLQTSTITWGLLFTVFICFSVYYFRASAGEYGGLVQEEYCPVALPVSNVFDEGIDYTTYPFWQETPKFKRHYGDEKFSHIGGRLVEKAEIKRE